MSLFVMNCGYVISKNWPGFLAGPKAYLSCLPKDLSHTGDYSRHFRGRQL